MIPKSYPKPRPSRSAIRLAIFSSLELCPKSIGWGEVTSVFIELSADLLHGKGAGHIETGFDASWREDEAGERQAFQWGEIADRGFPKVKALK